MCALMRTQRATVTAAAPLGLLAATSTKASQSTRRNGILVRRAVALPPALRSVSCNQSQKAASCQFRRLRQQVVPLARSSSLVSRGYGQPGAKIEDQVTKGDTILESRAPAFQHGGAVEQMVCEGLSVTRSAAITALKDRKFGGGCRESTTRSPFAPTSCNFAIWPSLAKGNVLRSDRANCQDLSTF